jgi:hypothetical protein
MHRLSSVVGLILAAILPPAAALGDETSRLRITVVDAATQEPVAARVYLRDSDGASFFLEPSGPNGTAEPYDEQNWINERSVERYTNVSAHPMQVALPAGEYRLIVERGPSYLPAGKTFRVDGESGESIEQRVALVRFVDPAARGWFSGDTHLHRTVEELKTILPAEDLNVALPLTYWVTRGGTPPAAGDRNQAEIPRGLITVEPQRVIWPRNTEYEIFSIGETQHTLGALFVLGHKEPLELGVPPWEPVIEAVGQRDPQAVFDMDKLDWPFAMLLPTIAPGALYELANNHMWRTEFAFRQWNSAAPVWMRPPGGGDAGGHRQWIDTTHAMYYALLNCGLRLPVSGGTANGVHPVPAGFGRVYVHLRDGFSYEAWLRGLKAGRSFVTTGPFLEATAAGELPGAELDFEQGDAPIELQMELRSEQPLSYGEVVYNGRPLRLLRPANEPQADGSYRSELRVTLEPSESGWFVLRFFEPRPDGRTRFAHTAPWYVKVPGKPLRMARHERDYLVDRMRREIDRSGELLTSAAIDEYRRALEFYSSRPLRDDREAIAATARPAKGAELQRWLDNMAAHQFSAYEVRAATGLSLDNARGLLASRRARASAAAAEHGKPSGGQVRLLPYPGGRHPRKGFLEGAVRPQRETKVSLFPPWEEGGYVVVDVPEAIFSNLGLTYLAHTHIPTIWDERGVELERREWRGDADRLELHRPLPEGIAYDAEVRRESDGARMRLRLTNDGARPLSGLRVQMCTMLSAAVGFSDQDPLENRTEGPLIAVRGEHPRRWIITGWVPNHRVWTNPPVPCVHSDPIFPDCPPGESVEVRGGVWFYEGDAVEQRLQELAARLSGEAAAPESSTQ